MVASGGSRVELRVPSRPRIVRDWKAIVGPVRPLGGGLHMALHYVYPGPSSWRVEPHLVIDSSGTLELRGVYVLEGPVALAAHRGLDEAMRRGVSQGLFRSYHLAPWGAPVLYLERISKPDEEATRLLDGLGAWRALKWLEELQVEVRFE